jgi:hypothetical protein
MKQRGQWGCRAYERETTMLTNDFLAGVEVRHRHDQLSGGKSRGWFKGRKRG